MTLGTWEPTAIEGVLRRHSPLLEDERGSFTELWRSSWTDHFGERLVQLNLSRSRAGVLRGMHFHRRQIDVWMVAQGRALAATTDVRAMLAGTAQSAASQLVELGVGDCLFIPRQVAHGFLALDDLALIYLVSNEYDGTDELGFAWDDPSAAIGWPAGEPILSDRDQRNPALAELVESLRQQLPAR